MNIMPRETRIRIVHALVEGCSMRAASRMAGVSINTVMKLLVDLGASCQQFHDRTVKNIRTDRIQADEAWAFCYAKDKNLPESMRDKPGVGSIWTWTALDSDTKLMIAWHVGGRDADNAREFMLNLAGRLLNRVQLTTDGHGVYPRAVWEAFGTDIDYAQLVKIYGVPREGEARYSPAVYHGAIKSRVCGSPIPEDISTSHVERSNLTLRMGNRRYTRLTNGFSKKFENLCCSVALFFTYYNFCRVHKTLRVTPAMEAGLTDHVWTMEEFIGILEADEQAAIARGEMKRGKYRKSGHSNCDTTTVRVNATRRLPEAYHQKWLIGGNMLRDILDVVANLIPGQVGSLMGPVVSHKDLALLAKAQKEEAESSNDTEDGKNSVAQPPVEAKEQ